MKDGSVVLPRELVHKIISMLEEAIHPQTSFRDVYVLITFLLQKLNPGGEETHLEDTPGGEGDAE